MPPILSLFQKKSDQIQGEEQTKQSSSRDWSLLEEGHLLIDMYERPDAIVIRSLAAGVRPEDLDISVHNDILTIRGNREDCDGLYDDQFYMKECYWGTFNRSVVLPTLVHTDKIEAFFKNGVVTIILPKLEEAQSIPLQTEEDLLDE
ncbi:MAG: Hsp20/alpha crystallin family protein [bacterium]|nr:Hsp20/alpha crystallin family protein [bacterium]